jgi:iron complex outermembrane recepter protein
MDLCPTLGAMLFFAGWLAGPTEAQVPSTPGDHSEEPAAPDPAKRPAREAPHLTYAETLVVTASRTEETLSDAPASMTVIPPEQIASTPATGVAELLQGVAGLNVFHVNAREWNVAGRQAASVLGQGQLVLIDGRVINNGNGGMYWDQIPIDLDELKQVEILHGPASVVWGSNALSAVVNLRTKSPRELEGLQLTAGIGEVGVGLGSLRWAQAAEKVSYKLSASLYHHDAWPRSPTLPDGSPATGPLAYENVDVNQPKADVRLDYEPTNGRVWSFRSGYGGTSGIYFTNDLPFEFSRSTYMSYAEVSYRAPAVDGRVYWTRSAGSLRLLTDGSSSPFSADFPTAEINVRRPVTSNQLLVFGASARLDFFDVSVIPHRHSRHEFGGFVEDQIFPHPKLRINLGVRLDEVQTSGPAVSPRVSVLFKPAEPHGLRFSVSRAYRAPTPVENFLDLPTGYPVDLGPGATVLVPFSVVGNTSLDEVRSLGFELGYTGVLVRRHTFQATAYRAFASDTIQIGTTEFYSPDDPPATWPFPAPTVPRFALPKTASYRNTGKIRNQGLELSLNSAWPGGLWSALSYTYQAKPRLTDVAPGFEFAINDPPRQQASALLGWTRAPWRGSLGVIYTGRAFWTDVVVADPRLHGFTKSFVLTNLSASYAIPRTPLELTLKATNLFDHAVQQHVFGDIIGREISAYVRLDLKKRR